MSETSRGREGEAISEKEKERFFSEDPSTLDDRELDKAIDWVNGVLGSRNMTKDPRRFAFGYLAAEDCIERLDVLESEKIRRTKKDSNRT